MSPTARYLAWYAAYVAGVHLLPGPWRRWEKGRLVDNWTWTHLVWGALAQRMGLPLQTAVLLAAANEAGEAVLRRRRPGLVFGSPEGPANVAVDVAANAVGWKAAQLLK